jgi:hypothetical protein
LLSARSLGLGLGHKLAGRAAPNGRCRLRCAFVRHSSHDNRGGERIVGRQAVIARYWIAVAASHVDAPPTSLLQSRACVGASAPSSSCCSGRCKVLHCARAALSTSSVPSRPTRRLAAILRAGRIGVPFAPRGRPIHWVSVTRIFRRSSRTAGPGSRLPPSPSSASSSGPSPTSRGRRVPRRIRRQAPRVFSAGPLPS